MMFEWSEDQEVSEHPECLDPTQGFNELCQSICCTRVKGRKSFKRHDSHHSQDRAVTSYMCEQCISHGLEPLFAIKR